MNICVSTVINERWGGEGEMVGVEPHEGAFAVDLAQDEVTYRMKKMLNGHAVERFQVQRSYWRTAARKPTVT
jgi:hypothetical protein